jgi:hypothetical protein
MHRRLEAEHFRGNTNAQLVLNKPQKSIDIEIRGVTRFSYGELTDGDFAIWAEGKAGWFEIRPAPHYERIYADMIQAVQILYFVTDIYNEPRKSGRGPKHQLIFQEVGDWLRSQNGVLTRRSTPKMSDSHAPILFLQARYSTNIASSSSCAS